jgi:hypothetical protein
MISWVLVFTLVITGKPPTIIQRKLDISGTVYQTKAKCQEVSQTLWNNLTWKQDGLQMAATRFAECMPQKKEQM